jgi:hypothetical protein
VEMMHFGKNIFAFNCNCNRASTQNNAEYFPVVEELVDKIEQESSINNADGMKEIAHCRYTLNIVKRQYFELFK